jgi:hypothetical protein
LVQVLVITLITCFLKMLSAATVTWVAPGSASWHDPASWDVGAVPTVGDHVVIALASGQRLQLSSHAAATSVDLTFADETAGIDILSNQAMLSLAYRLQVSSSDVIRWHVPIQSLDESWRLRRSGSGYLIFDAPVFGDPEAILDVEVPGLIEFGDQFAFPGSVRLQKKTTLRLRENRTAPQMASLLLNNKKLYTNKSTNDDFISLNFPQIRGPGTLTFNSNVKVLGTIADDVVVHHTMRNTYMELTESAVIQDGTVDINAQTTLRINGHIDPVSLNIGLPTRREPSRIEGNGSVKFLIADPASPLSAANTRWHCSWHKSTPAFSSWLVWGGIIDAENLTLQVQVPDGLALDPALEYPLITYESMMHNALAVEQQSLQVHSPFQLNAPNGWQLIYQGTALNPNAVVLVHENNLAGLPIPVAGEGLLEEIYAGDEQGGLRTHSNIAPVGAWHVKYWGLRTGSLPQISPGAPYARFRYTGAYVPEYTSEHRLILKSHGGGSVFVNGEPVLLRVDKFGATSAPLFWVAGQMVDLEIVWWNLGDHEALFDAWLALPSGDVVRIEPERCFPAPEIAEGALAQTVYVDHFASRVVSQGTLAELDVDSAQVADLGVTTDRMVRWSGWLTFPRPGLYAFYVKGKSERQILFDHEIVMSNHRGNNVHTAVYEATEAGEQIHLSVDVFGNASVPEDLLLTWTPPHDVKHLIPAKYLAADDVFLVNKQVAHHISPAIVRTQRPNGIPVDLSIVNKEYDTQVVVPQYPISHLEGNSFWAHIGLNQNEPVVVDIEAGYPFPRADYGTSSVTVEWTPASLGYVDGSVLRPYDELLIRKADVTNEITLTASSIVESLPNTAEDESLVRKLFDSPGEYWLEERTASGDLVASALIQVVDLQIPTGTAVYSGRVSTIVLPGTIALRSGLITYSA